MKDYKISYIQGVYNPFSKWEDKIFLTLDQFVLLDSKGETYFIPDDVIENKIKMDWDCSKNPGDVKHQNRFPLLKEKGINIQD